MNTIFIIVCVAVFAFILYKGYKMITEKHDAPSIDTGGGGGSYHQNEKELGENTQNEEQVH